MSPFNDFLQSRKNIDPRNLTTEGQSRLLEIVWKFNFMTSLLHKASNNKLYGSLSHPYRWIEMKRWPPPTTFGGILCSSYLQIGREMAKSTVAFIAISDKVPKLDQTSHLSTFTFMLEPIQSKCNRLKKKWEQDERRRGQGERESEREYPKSSRKSTLILNSVPRIRR